MFSTLTENDLSMGIQAALHSLANIVGETRKENSMVLESNAEETLRRLVYEKAANTSKLTPSVNQFFEFFST